MEDVWSVYPIFIISYDVPAVTCGFVITSFPGLSSSVWPQFVLNLPRSVSHHPENLSHHVPEHFPSCHSPHIDTPHLKRDFMMHWRVS